MTYLEALIPRQADSYNVLEAVVRANPVIATLTTFTPRLAPQLLERGQMTSEDMEIIEAAHVLKANTSLPFWDAVMTTLMRADRPPEKVLTAALYHNPINDGLQTLHVKNVVRSQLLAVEANLPTNSILAVASRVVCTDGVVRHIPQIDFHCPESAATTELVLSVLNALRLRGYLLASGKSFHFYGIELLAENELTRFLGRVLLFSPIVDRAWISHQLIEGQTALRLSSRPGYGAPPKLVSLVN
jgi:hypothetical protein